MQEFIVTTPVVVFTSHVNALGSNKVVNDPPGIVKADVQLTQYDVEPDP